MTGTDVLNEKNLQKFVCLNIILWKSKKKTLREMFDPGARQILLFALLSAKCLGGGGNIIVVSFLTHSLKK